MVNSSNVNAANSNQAASTQNTCTGGTPESEGVVLFEDINYQGQCVVFSGDSSDLRQLDFNDKTSSIKFNGKYATDWQVVLYEDVEYQGKSLILTASNPDLRIDLVGNDQVSSIQIRQ